MSFISKSTFASMCLFVTLSAPYSYAAGEIQEPYAPSSNKSAYDNFDVLSRERPDYQARGIPAGKFTALPTLNVTAVSNDNIYASDANKDADMIGIVSPELLLKSNFNNHALDFKLGGDVGRFLDKDSEDYENYYTNLDGRLDIQKDFNLTSGFGYSKLTEDRTSSLAPQTSDAPVEYQKTGGYLGANKAFNRLTLQTSADITRYDYDDANTTTGANLDQDARDLDVMSLNGRTDYEFSPGYKAFVKGTLSKRDYYNDDTRNSDGYRATTGVAAELTNLVVGELEAGYTRRNYDNFKDLGSFVYGAAVNWYPTPLATVRGTIDREIVDGTDTSIAGASVSGILQTRYGAEVNIEALRNLIITPKVAYIDGQYQGNDNEEQTYSAGLTADYFINRYVSVQAGYDYSTRDASAPISGLEYDRNLFTLALKTKI